jgi:phage tail P2-like protein
MRLTQIRVADLAPPQLRDDPLVVAVAAALDKILRQLAERIPVLSVWGQIDHMNDVDLDDAARELAIPWWRADVPIGVKRQVLKDAPAVLARLGTPWAVETVASAFFEGAWVQEWWEFGGQPGTFRIEVSDPVATEGREAEFLRLVDLVKRKSQHLVSVETTAKLAASRFVGVGLHQVVFQVLRTVVPE